MKMSSRAVGKPLLPAILTATILMSAVASSSAWADSVDAWGWNDYGQLGDGTKTNRSSPVAIPSLSSGVTAIAAGGLHSLAVQNGAVFAWGDNEFYGQLGDGTTTSRSSPVAIPSLSSGVTAIAAGTSHSLAVQNGAVFAWGDNLDGQLGDGTTALTRPFPVAITSLSSGVTAIAGGFIYSLAVKNSAVYAWGYNGQGQLGDGTFTAHLSPIPVSSLSSGVTAVAGGQGCSLAVKNGAVYAWGDNEYGQIGDGTTTSRSSPVLIPGLSNIVQVAASYYNEALASDGSLWVWGRNEAGQLGLGDKINRLTPVHLLPPTGFIYTSVVGGAGDGHTLATLSATPQIQIVNRTPVTTLTTVKQSSTASNNLRVYSSFWNLFFPAGGPETAGYIDPTLPTIVLTHGFTSDPSMWKEFAKEYPGVGTKVNVVAWDWSGDNGSKLPATGLPDPATLGPAASATLREGSALGQSLLSVLGSNYNLPIHFIGHSLGTLVNAQAVNVFDAPITSGGTGDGAKTQVTIFDDAEIANEYSSSKSFAPAIPAVTVAQIDNYVSAFGTPKEFLPNVVNVMLDYSQSPQDIYSFHAYPVGWYKETFPTPTNPLGLEGYEWSVDRGFGSAPLGQYLQQSASQGNARFLAPITRQDADAIIAKRDGAPGDIGISTYFTIGQLMNSTIQAVGNVSTLLVGPSFALKYVVGGSTTISPQVMRSQAITSATASPSYAWTQMHIPEGAQDISFDFTYKGVDTNDMLLVGINGTQLFALEGAYVPDGVTENSGLVNVSAWAGQDVELFIGNTGIAPNGSMTVENITFISIPEPTSLCLLATGTLLLIRRRRC